jgi:hypothetical protein
MCIQDDCPFDCCLESEDGFIEKKCSNGGSCVNNKCILKTCPSEFECCYDEIDFEDKSCTGGKTCINRKCKVAIIEMIKNYFKKN